MEEQKNKKLKSFGFDYEFNEKHSLDKVWLKNSLKLFTHRTIFMLSSIIGSDEFSIHKGIFIFWDEDYDTRILTFVDQLPKFKREHLIAVHERKASLTLIYDLCAKNNPVCIFGEEKDEREAEVEHDIWCVDVKFLTEKNVLISQ